MGILVGVDEVGRGCWAGPLLVVAAKLKESAELPHGLKDSKKLSKKSREEFIADIVGSCRLGEGWVQPEEIDSLGLSKAMRLGVSRALIALGIGFEEQIIMDGNINYCPEEYLNVTTVIKADALHPIVSAASIYAKVKRDEHMSRLAKFHPFYGFEKHVGYGTDLHRSTLKIYGVSKIHRISFKPVKLFI